MPALAEDDKLGHAIERLAGDGACKAHGASGCAVACRLLTAAASLAQLQLDQVLQAANVGQELGHGLGKQCLQGTQGDAG